MSETPAGPAQLAALPSWPLYLMFGLVPLWWLTGAFYVVWPLYGLLMLALLATRGSVPLPAGVACWLAFATLVALSASRLQHLQDLATSGLRLSFYLTALTVCVYVYTLVREGAEPARVLAPVTAFWLALVALGWLGVIDPGLSVTTPVERLLPSGLSASPFVHDLVHGYATEFRSNGVPTGRPAAPYPYTNNWGSTYALLMPCVLAYLAYPRQPQRRGWRAVLLASLPMSLPPAFLTLNRGMFLSLAAALLFTAVRAVRHGHRRLLAGLGVLIVLGVGAAQVIGVDTLIAHRVATSASTEDRISLYAETLRRIVHAPLLGYGAPATVDTTSAPAPVGTQGQLWLVLFSHGVPALAVFLAWFGVVVRSALRAQSPAGLWLSAVVVAALVQVPIYGLTYQNLTVLFAAAGVVLAEVTPPRRPAPGAVALTRPVAQETGSGR